MSIRLETYGINHNASKQEFQEPKAPEDFRKIEYYFEDFHEGRNCRAVSVRILGISKSISGHLVITRATWDDNMNDRCK